MEGKITRIMVTYDIPQVVFNINRVLYFLRGALRKISYILFRYHSIWGWGVFFGIINITV